MRCNNGQVEVDKHVLAVVLLHFPSRGLMSQHL